MKPSKNKFLLRCSAFVRKARWPRNKEAGFGFSGETQRGSPELTVTLVPIGSKQLRETRSSPDVGTAAARQK